MLNTVLIIYIERFYQVPILYILIENNKNLNKSSKFALILQSKKHMLLLIVYIN
jgi:hypothetical protein